MTEPILTLTDATLSLDKISGRGEVSADLTGSVPKISGRLDLGMVDINPYMPAGEAPARSAVVVEGKALGGNDRSVIRHLEKHCASVARLNVRQRDRQ